MILFPPFLFSFPFFFLLCKKSKTCYFSFVFLKKEKKKIYFSVKKYWGMSCLYSIKKRVVLNYTPLYKHFGLDSFFRLWRSMEAHPRPSSLSKETNRVEKKTYRYSIQRNHGQSPASSGYSLGTLGGSTRTHQEVNFLFFCLPVRNILSTAGIAPSICSTVSQFPKSNWISREDSWCVQRCRKIHKATKEVGTVCRKS